MPNVMSLGTARKAAASDVRIPCDFGDMPLLIAGYTISSYDITISGSGAPTISSKQLDYSYQISGFFTGGTAGNYDVVFSIILNDPNSTEYACTGVLQVF